MDVEAYCLRLRARGSSSTPDAWVGDMAITAHTIEEAPPYYCCRENLRKINSMKYSGYCKTHGQV